MTYFDLGRYRRSVTTTSDEARTWFDRGLVWTYGFNHEESVRCFERAVAADPGCALAWWGIAYALGPNYNKPWEFFDAADLRTTVQRTHDALGRALALVDGVTPVERALVEALVHRYPAIADLHGIDAERRALVRQAQSREDLPRRRQRTRRGCLQRAECHRRVVDELLVDHRDVARAHRHAGHVAAVGEYAACGRRVEPGHHAHQRRLAGLRRAEQHRHRARLEPQVERVQVRIRADALLDALERQFHQLSPAAATAAAVSSRVSPQRAAHQAATAARSPSFRCRPSLVRRHSTSSAERAHSCA